MTERSSIIFYRSFYEAIKALNSEDALSLTMRILKYSFDGDDTPCNKKYIEAMFQMCKPVIDQNNKKYEAGKRGGRPKKKPIAINTDADDDLDKRLRSEGYEPMHTKTFLDNL